MSLGAQIKMNENLMEETRIFSEIDCELFAKLFYYVYR